MLSDPAGLGLVPALVVLCPPLPDTAAEPQWYPRCRRVLAEAGYEVADVPVAGAGADIFQTPGEHPPGSGGYLPGWVARVAGAIRAGTPNAPLVVVAASAAVVALPMLALSQRSQHRSIVGYVVVDADLSPPLEPGTDWPGAPVTYVRSPGEDERGWRTAGLRGWQRVAGDPVAAVLAAVADLPRD